MGRNLAIVFAFLLLSFPVAAQIGGNRAFEYLNLPPSAKIAGIGGINVSSRDHDVNMVYGNPALLNKETIHQLSFGHNGFLGDVRQNSLTFGAGNKSNGFWAGGIQYLDYGDFIQRDETGLEQGSFNVAEYALNATHARTIENITLGITAKLGVSQIAEFKSTAMLADIGGVFKHPKQDFTVGLVFKNIGYQLSTYNGEKREPMPFDAQVGMSYKLEHMPLKFSITAHHLQKFDIAYLDTSATGQLDDQGNPVKPEKSYFDMAARHFVFAGEFIFSKNFNLRFGYNHLRRRELRLQTTAGGAGLSFGAMIRIKGIELDYSRAYYHVAGAANYFTVSTSLSRWFRKKAPETPVEG